MLAIEICSNCKFLDCEDIPNLWCRKLDDFLNGSEVTELAEAGCRKMQVVLEYEKLSLEKNEVSASEDEQDE